MEILAENRFYMTKPLFFEGMARISKDTYGKWAKKFTLVLLLVWAAAAMLLPFTEEKSYLLFIARSKKTSQFSALATAVCSRVFSP